jgi:hypothetical protein
MSEVPLYWRAHPRWLADYSKVDKLGVSYNPVNFGETERPSGTGQNLVSKNVLIKQF